MFQVIHFLIRCEPQFSEVLPENLKCARVKLLLETYLACSVKPPKVMGILLLLVKNLLDI